MELHRGNMSQLWHGDNVSDGIERNESEGLGGEDSN